MKKILQNLLLAALLAVTGVRLAMAAGEVPVQPIGTRLDAGTATCTGTGAGNTTVTCTITGQSGVSIYLTFFDIEIGANAAVTGAGVIQACVTTGLVNNMTFAADNSSLTTGQLRAQPYNLATPIKWPAGVSAVISCSGLQSTQTVRVNAAGYYAP